MNGDRFATERKLADFAAAALVACGVPPHDARAVARVLVAADLRGADAHGVAKLGSDYVPGLRSGAIVAVPAVAVLRETPTSIVIDAGRGLGAPVALRAMNAVLDRAERAGAAFAAVRNSHHFGIAGYYAMLALDRGMIGIASTNAARAMAPTYGAAPMLGANPWAYAIPAGNEPPFVLDFASTAPRDAAHPAWPVAPLGGFGTDNGGHKGFGLGLLADIMCAVLSGGAFGGALGDERETASGGISHFFGAFRVDGMRDVGDFARDMDRELRAFKDSEKAPGSPRIYVAGEREHELTAERRARGIPLPPRAWAGLETLAAELGLPFDLAPPGM